MTSNSIEIALDKIAMQLSRLGTHNAATDMGAIELLAVAVQEAGNANAAAIEKGLEDIASATHQGLFEIAEAIRVNGGAV